MAKSLSLSATQSSAAVWTRFASVASGSLKTSHVLHAMGWDEAVASEVVRVSFGPQTSESDVDRFLAAWTAMAARARR